MGNEHPSGAGEAARTRSLGCTRCPALVASRSRVVPGSGGNAPAVVVVVVGLAPGADEDALGLPLAGQGRALLDGLLARAGVAPEATFTTPLVKCLPPGNRDPSPAEVANCSEHLVAQLELLRPVVVVALGGAVTKVLRGSAAPIREVRGREEPRVLGSAAFWLLPVFHPDAALYAPALAEQLGADLARLPELVARGHPAVEAAAPEEDGADPGVPDGPDPDVEPVAAPGPDQLGLF